MCPAPNYPCWGYSWIILGMEGKQCNLGVFGGMAPFPCGLERRLYLHCCGIQDWHITQGREVSMMSKRNLKLCFHVRLIETWECISRIRCCINKSKMDIFSSYYFRMLFIIYWLMDIPSNWVIASHLPYIDWCEREIKRKHEKINLGTLQNTAIYLVAIIEQTRDGSVKKSKQQTA